MFTRNCLCILVIIIAFKLPSNAQFTKKTRMVGATIGSAFFNSGTYDYTYPGTNGYTSHTNSLGVEVGPNYGWFINEHIALGAQLLLSYKYDKRIDAANNITFAKDIYKTLAPGLTIFSRGYIPVKGSFLPFAQVSLGFATGSSESEGFNYHSTYKETYNGKSSSDFSFNAGLTAGVTKMLNTHVGLDFYMGYAYNKNKTQFVTKSERDIGLDGTIDETGELDQTRNAALHNFVIGAGLQIFLQKKNNK